MCYYTNRKGACVTEGRPISESREPGDVAGALGRVLVTGASGRIGRAVVEELQTRGVEVTALVLEEATLPVARVVVGDAGDPVAARAAVEGVDAVVHLAARPSPAAGTPLEVFAGNTGATFSILEAAGAAGIRRAVIASSYAIAGLTFGRSPARPPYLPLDAEIPLQISDPYALSKQVDEATAAMMARRHGMSITSLRLPFVAGYGELARAYRRYAADPAAGASEVWSYLDVRDAAHALLLAIQRAPAGAPVLYVAAPDTLSPEPTEQLLDAHLAGVPRRRRFPGRTVPIDLAPAAEILGFAARHPFRPGRSGDD